MPDENVRATLGAPEDRESLRLGKVLAEMAPKDWLFRAIVTGVNGNLITFKRPGEAAFSQGYPSIDGISVITDDEVLVGRIAGGFVVIGKLVR